MTEATKLAQAVDQAVADYQRHFGRPQTIEKLAHMLRARQEAQRVMDEANGRIGGEIPRAAE